MNKLLSVALALFIGLSSMSADAAKRMGSGKSFGKQSTNVTQNQATKPAPNATPPAAAPAQPRRPWGAMLGGLAAGLGLAWLASSLGFGEEHKNVEQHSDDVDVEQQCAKDVFVDCDFTQDLYLDHIDEKQDAGD